MNRHARTFEERCCIWKNGSNWQRNGNCGVRLVERLIFALTMMILTAEGAALRN